MRNQFQPVGTAPECCEVWLRTPTCNLRAIKVPNPECEGGLGDPFIWVAVDENDAPPCWVKGVCRAESEQPTGWAKAAAPIEVEKSKRAATAAKMALS